MRSWTCLLKRWLFGASMGPARRPRRKSPRLRVQVLESRWLPSGTPASLPFVPVQNPSDPAVKFLAAGNNYDVLLSPAEAAFTLPVAVVDASSTALPTPFVQLQFIGASPSGPVIGVEASAGTAARYNMVEAAQLYPGVSVTYYGTQGQLEYDFRIAPGASAQTIQLQFTGSSGVSLDSAGDLVVHTAYGALTEKAPNVYQMIGGQRHAVQGGYVLEGGNRVGLQVGAYDASQPLIIDPLNITTDTWTGAANDGEWANPANWDTGQIPGPTNDVIIPTGFSTITHDTGTDSINSLEADSPLVLSGGSLTTADFSTINADFTLSGGALQTNATLVFNGTTTTLSSGTLGGYFSDYGYGSIVLDGDLTIDLSGVNFYFSPGVFQWTGGSLTGGTIYNYESMELASTDTLVLQGLQLQNFGTIIQDGTGSLDLQNSATVYVGYSGVYELDDGGTLSSTDTSGAVLNYGLFTEVGDPTIPATISAAFVNGSSLDVAGTLDLTGSVSSLSGGTLQSGSWTVENSAKLTIANGDDTLTINEANITLVGTGRFTNLATLTENDGTINLLNDATLVLDGLTNIGTLNLAASSFVASTLTNNGQIDIDATSVVSTPNLTNFDSSTGTLNGGTYDVAGTFQFNGAAITTDNAQIVLDGIGGTIVDQSDANALTGLDSITVSGSFTLTNNAAFETTLAFSNAGLLAVSDGAAFDLASSQSFSNSGIVQLSGANAQFHMAGSFLNGGNFDLLGLGDAALTGSLTNGAFIDVEVGALLTPTVLTNLDTSTGTLTGGSYYIGGTLQLNGDITKLASTNLTLAGAGVVLDGNSENALAGLGEIDASSSFSLEISASFQAATGLVNNGIVFIDSDSTFSTANPLFNNGGLNVDNGSAFSSTSALTNNGSFNLFSGSATVGPFSNNGAVTVDQSSFLLANQLTNFDHSTGDLVGGSYLIGGVFEFSGAAITTDSANLVLDGVSAQILDRNGNNALAGFTAVDSSGQLTLSDGFILDVFAFTNQGSVTVQGPSVFRVDDASYTQTAGSTSLWNGGTLATPAGAVDIQGGMLGASGPNTIVGDLLNAGTVFGDGNVGTLAITGDYTQSGSGLLHLQLESTGSGDYDQLDVAGTVSLVGGSTSVQVETIGGFSTAPGQAYELLTFNARSGDFANYSVPASTYPEYTGSALVLFTTAPLFVNTTADDAIADPPGDVTLRDALNEANVMGGLVPILFAIPTTDSGYNPTTGTFTLTPTIAWPVITQSVWLDGSSQPGFAGTPIVKLDGSQAGPGVSGLVLETIGSTIAGFAIDNFSADGILIQPGGTNPSVYDNRVFGNDIGLDPDGTTAQGNGSHGVEIYADAVVGGFAFNNTIGSVLGVRTNVISANGGDGIALDGADSNSNFIEGNRIGTDAAGAAPRGNAGYGIEVFNSSIANTIGGTATGAGNVISGNSLGGIALQAGSNFTHVDGNQIGTSADNTAPLGNQGPGVFVASDYCTIGDSVAGNVIAGNNGDGILITGNSATITNNIIGGFANQGNGIELVDATYATLSGNTVIKNTRDGVLISGGTGHTLSGNAIGTDSRGTAGLGNAGNGIEITNGSSENSIDGTIGGSGSSANIIAGNGLDGILISGLGTDFNQVYGSIIGELGHDSVPLGNGGAGIEIADGASNNFIFGGVIIVLNAGAGVSIHDQGTTDNGVSNSFIGTDAGSLIGLGNGGSGLEVWNGAQGNTAYDNVIASNSGDGIWIHDLNTTANTFETNSIGTDFAGNSGLGNVGVGVEIMNQASGNQIIGANVIAGNSNDGVSIHDVGTTGNTVSSNDIGLVNNGETSLGNAGAGVHVWGGAAFNTIGDAVFGGNIIGANAGDGITIEGAGTSNTSIGLNYIGIDGLGATAVGNGGNGITLNQVIGTFITLDLISGNTGNGVDITGINSVGTLLEGNTIGTDATGSVAVPNAGNGVLVENNAPSTVIGLSIPSGSNLISGNQLAGILITTGASNTLIQNNLIGTDRSGTAILGNGGAGVMIDSASYNTVGGVDGGTGNIISGNTGAGVAIQSGSTNNVVVGNFVGTDLTGTAAVPNHDFGISVVDSQYNTIGGLAPGAGNIVSGGGRDGIALGGVNDAHNAIQGNRVGVDAYGNALGNALNGIYIDAGGSESIAGNIISGNGGSGIYVHASSANLIADNRIGTDPTGLSGVANTMSGVILDSSQNNVLSGNVVSANGQNGIEITGSTATGNLVQGNSIGTDVNGSIPLGNGLAGIELDSGAHGNLIGTDGDGINDAVEGNLIAANGHSGLVLTDFGTNNNVIAGNNIGTDAANDPGLGNGRYGVYIGNGASYNLVGSSATDADPSGERNVISASAWSGVYINGSTSTNNTVAGNYIGTDVSGTVNLGNAGRGIYVQGDVSTPLTGTIIRDNVVSGNGTGETVASGIRLQNDAGSIVQGNLIGTDYTGTAPLGNGLYGLRLVSSTDDTVVGNIISANLSAGVVIEGGSRNVLQGNSIGVYNSAVSLLANGGDGIKVDNSADDTIGGSAAADGNTVSGNSGAGIELLGPGTKNAVVAGNHIGTDATGMQYLGNNNYGVLIQGASNNLIGGTDIGAGNLISANNRGGIKIFSDSISGATGDDNLVLGNIIGLSAAGTALGNAGPGVLLADGANVNTIGSTAIGAANTIADNGGAGVAVVGSAAANRIQANSIVGNTGLGIDLGNDGVTANHTGVASGPNELQNFPVIATAVGGPTTQVSGTLNALANNTYILDFYANSTADPSGHGQGERWLGSVSVLTDASGNGSFTATLSALTRGNEVITATATDAFGNTSEFAQDLLIPGVPAPMVVIGLSADGSPVNSNLSASVNTPAPTLYAVVTPPLTTQQPVYSYSWSVVNTSDPTFSLPTTVSTTGDTFQFAPTEAGTYAISVLVSDQFGNHVTAGPVTLIVTAAVPTVSINGVATNGTAAPAPTASPVGTQINLAGLFTDPNSTTSYQYSWTVAGPVGGYTLPAGTVTSGTISGLSGSGPFTVPGFALIPTTEGQFTVTLTVTDSAGAVAASMQTITVTMPTIIPLTGTTAAEGTPLSFQTNVDATVTSLFTFSWSVTNPNDPTYHLPAGTPTNGALFTFTPPDEGTYNVAVTLTNAQGVNAANPLALTIGEATPMVTVSTPSAVQLGQPITLSASATDAIPGAPNSGSADTYTLTWTVQLNGQPFTGTVSTTSTGPGSGTATFTPTVAGTYRVIVVADDGHGGTGSATAQLPQPVRQVNLTVQPSGTQLLEAQPFSVQAAVVNPPAGVPFDYRWTLNAPDGTTATVDTGSVATLNLPRAGVLAHVIPGGYTVTVSVAGGDNSTGTAAASFTVGNVVPTVSLTAPTPPAGQVHFREGDTIAFTAANVSLADPGIDLANPAYNWTVTYGGATVAQGSASSFNFAPAEQGSYTVQLQVTDGSGGIGSNSVVLTVDPGSVLPVIVNNGSFVDSSGTLQVNLAVQLQSYADDDDVAALQNASWQITSGGTASMGFGSAFSFPARPGRTYTVAVTVTNDDGSGTATAELSVASASGNSFTFDTSSGMSQVVLVTGSNDTVTASADPGMTLTIAAVGFGNTFQGTSGNLIFQGDSSNNMLIGGSGTNTFYGSASDTLVSGTGSNLFVPMLGTGSAPLNIIATSGSNTLSFASSSLGVTLNLTQTGTTQNLNSQDQLVFSGNLQTLIGSPQADMLTAASNTQIMGGDGNDTLVSSGQSNVTLLGGSGNVSLLAQGGNNLMLMGGTGSAIITASADALFGTASNVTILGGSGGSNLLSGVANNLQIIGSTAGNDMLDGTGNNLFLSGMGANDTLIGSGSNMTLSASGQNTSLFGSGLNFSLGSTGSHDSLLGSGSNMTLAASGGNSALTGSGNNFSLASTGGRDSLLGSGSNMTLAASGGFASLSATATNGTLYSTGGHDSLLGSGGNLTLLATGGNSSLTGSGNNVQIQSTGGHDSLLGSGSNMTLAASGSFASLSATATNGTLYSTGGHDSLLGSGGNLTLLATGGNSSLTGSGNNVQIQSTGFNDSLLGSGSNMTLAASGGFASLSATATNGTLYTTGGHDSLLGSGGNLTLLATGGNSSLTGSGNNIQVRSTGSHDSLLGSGSNMTLAASGGFASLSATATNGTLYSTGGHDSLLGSGGNLTLLATGGNSSLSGSGNNVQIQSTGFNDSLLGSGSNMTLAASGGFASLSATATNGTLYSTGGHDSLLGSGGNLTLLATGGNSSLTGSGNNIQVRSTGGHDSLLGSGGNLTLAASGGFASLSATATNGTLYSTGGHDSLLGSGGNLTLLATGGDSSLTGSGNNVQIQSTGGHDSLLGSGSNMTLAASGGFASLSATATNGTLYSTGGHDSLLGSGGNLTLLATGGNSSLTGSGNNIQVRSTGGHDSLLGSGGNLTLLATGGNSSLTGTGNDMTLASTGGHDSLTGSGSNMTLAASGGRDTLVANGVTDGNLISQSTTGDSLVANGGSNVSLFGGSGPDTLVANGGTHIGLFGEGGNNLYVLSAGSSSLSVVLDDLQTSGLAPTPVDQPPLGLNTIAFPGANGITLDLRDTALASNAASVVQPVTAGIQLSLVGLFQGVIGTSGTDHIQGNSSTNILVAGSGNTTVIAGSGPTTMVAGTGNDSFVGGTGGDTYRFGGTGLGTDIIDQANTANTDTLDLSGLGTAANINLGSTAAQAVGAGLTLTMKQADLANVIGTQFDDTITGNSRDNRIYVGPGNDVLAGAGGMDSYVFGNHLGSDTINDSAATSHDFLNYRGFGGPINIDLSKTSQTVAGNATLTVADPSAIVGLVGTDYSDSIQGNAGNDTLVGGGGSDYIVAGNGDNYLQAGITEVVLLDFTRYTTSADDHSYTPAEQRGILAELQSIFEPYQFVFTQDPAQAAQLAQATGGDYVTLYFNRPPGPGGQADEIDLRNLDLGSQGGIDVNHAIVNGVDISTLTGQQASQDFIRLSAAVAAHELGHLVGLRHADAFGPIGSGIFAQFAAAYGSYLGPTNASTIETGQHVMVSPAEFGYADDNILLTQPYFGERESVKMAFDDAGTVVNTPSPAPTSLATADALGVLPGLQVYNDLGAGSQNAGLSFAVRAIDVVGSLAVVPGTQDFSVHYFSFQGHAGDLMNFELLSSILTRNQEPFNTRIQILDASGQVQISNDDEFESTDSAIVDYVLPADGQYYVVVSASAPAAAGQTSGNYELFMYSFAAGQGHTSLGGGSTLIGGSGHDTIVASTANDHISFAAGSMGDAVILGGSGADLVDLRSAPGENATVSPLSKPEGTITFLREPEVAPAFPDTPPTPSAAEGTLLQFGAAVSNPDPADRYALVADPNSDNPFPTGAAIDSTGAITWVAADEGTYAVRILIINGAGQTASEDVLITITAAAPQAEIVSINSHPVSSGVEVDLQGSVSAPVAGDAYQLTWTITVGGEVYASGTTTSTGTDLAAFDFTATTTGTYTVSVVATETDSGLTGDAETVNLFVSAGDAALTAGVFTPPMATEGHPLQNVTVFTFTDADPNATVADYTAVINLGDGNSVTLTGSAGSDGQIVADPSGTGFDVQLSYTYAEEVSGATFAVTVYDTAGGRTISDSSDSTASASTDSFSVADAPLTAGTLTPPKATEGQAFTGTVFTFTDANLNGTADDFSAVVTLGDGNTVTLTGSAGADGQIVADPAVRGQFDVVLSYTYADELSGASFGVQVSDLGGAAPISASNTFSVADAPLSASGGTVFPLAEGHSFSSAVLAHFVDTGGAEALSAYSLTVDWGDGSALDTSAQIVSDGNGGFNVLGSHLYKQDSSAAGYTITVNIMHDSLAPTVVTDTAQVSEQALAVVSVLTSKVKGYQGIATSKLQLATFADGDGMPVAYSTYLVTVAWGDGTSNTSADGSGTVSFTVDSNNHIVVSGKHSYTAGGVMHPVVTLSEDGGTNSISSTSTGGGNNGGVIEVDVAASEPTSRPSVTNRRNPVTGVWTGVVTMMYTGSQILNSGLSVVLSGLNQTPPPGAQPVTLKSATITVSGHTYTLTIKTDAAGDPVIYIPTSVLASLASGQSFTLNLTFNDPNNLTFGYNPLLFSDPFQNQ